MNELWPWLTLALLGAYHGINPAMGWLFAVALGLQERRRAGVVRAFAPIALGHAASIAAAVALLSAAQTLVDLAALRRSEDSFMDELIEDLSERGFPTVRVNFPRSYVDVNREPYELDPRMFTGRLPSFANTRSMRVAGGLGTIPRVVGDGQEIYREQTEPLIDVYRSRGILIEVDGMGEVDEVTSRIFDALDVVPQS